MALTSPASAAATAVTTVADAAARPTDSARDEGVTTGEGQACAGTEAGAEGLEDAGAPTATAATAETAVTAVTDAEGLEDAALLVPDANCLKTYSPLPGAAPTLGVF